MSMIKVKKIQGTAHEGVMRILLSVIFSFAASILLLLLGAVIFTVTNLSPNATAPMMSIITYLSVLLAGVIAGAGAKRRGWMRGAIAGSLYLVAVRVLGWLTVGAPLLSTLLSALFIGFSVGAVGGIAGINIFRKK